jgi:hypothetical protein
MSAAPTLDELASTAIDALAAINLIQTTWTNSVKRGGYAANFRDAPRISDDLLEALYEEMVFFDAEAAETLSEIRFQNEPTEADYTGTWPSASDVEFDFAASRGVA